MQHLAADQQLTLEAFQTAVTLCQQRQIILPETIVTILPNLASHIDRLDAIAAAHPEFDNIYQTARGTLEIQAQSRSKFLQNGDKTAALGEIIIQGDRVEGDQVEGSRVQGDTLTPANIQRFVLPANATDQERKYFNNYIAELKSLNPGWHLAPDTPRSGEAEAYVMLSNDVDYKINYAAYTASQMLNKFFSRS